MVMSPILNNCGLQYHALNPYDEGRSRGALRSTDGLSPNFLLHRRIQVPKGLFDGE
jgi:hypothetical protein